MSESHFRISNLNATDSTTRMRTSCKTRTRDKALRNSPEIRYVSVIPLRVSDLTVTDSTMRTVRMIKTMKMMKTTTLCSHPQKSAM